MKKTNAICNRLMWFFGAFAIVGGILGWGVGSVPLALLFLGGGTAVLIVMGLVSAYFLTLFPNHKMTMTDDLPEQLRRNERWRGDEQHPHCVRRVKAELHNAEENLGDIYFHQHYLQNAKHMPSAYWQTAHHLALWILKRSFRGNVDVEARYIEDLKEGLTRFDQTGSVVELLYALKTQKRALEQLRSDIQAQKRSKKRDQFIRDLNERLHVIEENIADFDSLKVSQAARANQPENQLPRDFKHFSLDIEYGARAAAKAKTRHLRRKVYEAKDCEELRREVDRMRAAGEISDRSADDLQRQIEEYENSGRSDRLTLYLDE